MIRFLTRLGRRRRRSEVDTLTRLPMPAPVSLPVTVQPEVTGEDELMVRARLFQLLGVGRPR